MLLRSAVFSLAAAATGGFSLLLLVPLLSLVGLGSAQPSSISMTVHSILTLLHIQPTLISVLGLFAASQIFASGLQRSQWLATNDLSLQFPLMLRKELYAAIANSSWSQFTSLRNSSLLQTLTGEVDRVATASTMISCLALESLRLGVYLFIALWLMPLRAALGLGLGGFLFLFLRAQLKKSYQLGKDVSAEANELYETISMSLEGFHVARCYGIESRHQERVFSNLEQIATTTRESCANHANSQFQLQVVSSLCLCLVCFVAVERLHLEATTVLLLVFLFSRIVPSISSVAQYLQQFLLNAPAYESIGKLLVQCHTTLPTTVTVDVALKFEKELCFEAVSYSYPGTQVSQVDNLTLIIPAGKTTVIVGPSGAGKSTAVDMILGLQAPDTGKILIDGKTLCLEMLDCWRAMVGYVPQRPFLFHDTIRENLLWAKPEASETELWEALEKAAAAGFIKELPGGLETSIGDRGSKLSGGQCQRISLARALLRKPKLLILDEATSALDEENERQVMEAIHNCHESTTVLVVTHRLSILKYGHQHYRMEQGCLKDEPLA